MPNWLIHAISDVILYAILAFFGVESTALLFLLASNLIDIDHLLVRPIYDPRRKSVGFHMLHKKRLLPFFILGCFIPTTAKFFFIGILLHLLLDTIEYDVCISKKWSK
jgi:hypothetical protein